MGHDGPVRRGERPSRVPLLAGHGPLAKIPPVLAFVVVIGLFVVAMVVRGHTPSCASPTTVVSMVAAGSSLPMCRISASGA